MSAKLVFTPMLLPCLRTVKNEAVTYVCILLRAQLLDLCASVKVTATGIVGQAQCFVENPSGNTDWFPIKVENDPPSFAGSGFVLDEHAAAAQTIGFLGLAGDETLELCLPYPPTFVSGAKESDEFVIYFKSAPKAEGEQPDGKEIAD